MTVQWNLDLKTQHAKNNLLGSTRIWTYMDAHSDAAFPATALYHLSHTNILLPTTRLYN